MTAFLLTLTFVLGILVLAFGAYLAWVPAGFIVLGAALVVVPLLYARGELRQPPG